MWFCEIMAKLCSNNQVKITMFTDKFKYCVFLFTEYYMDITERSYILITSESPRVKRDEFYVLSGLSISQGIIQCSTLCSVACIKTINILFQSQVFEVDQKADPQEEVNISEGTFNSKK